MPGKCLLYYTSSQSPAHECIVPTSNVRGVTVGVLCARQIKRTHAQAPLALLLQTCLVSSRALLERSTSLALAGPQLRKPAADRVLERSRRSGLRDRPFVHHDDPVGMHNRVQAMGDGEDGRVAEAAL